MRRSSSFLTIRGSLAYERDRTSESNYSINDSELINSLSLSFSTYFRVTRNFEVAQYLKASCFIVLRSFGSVPIGKSGCSLCNWASSVDMAG